MQTSFPSPDGRFILHLGVITMRMSHEVYSPYLVETATEKVLFDPGDLWDAGGIEWAADSSKLSMGTRQYDDGLTGFELVIEPGKDLATLTLEGEVIYTGSMDEVALKMSHHGYDEDED